MDRKNITDRLRAMSVRPVTDWRFHCPDLPHGEDPSLDDSQWQHIKTDPSLLQAVQQGPESLPGWYRNLLVIPAAAGGKNISDARVRLSVLINPEALFGFPEVRVFLNGTLAAVAEGGGQRSLVILVTQKASPGEQLLLAINLMRRNSQKFRFFGCELLFDHPNRPDPGVLAEQVLSAEVLISGFPTVKAQREKQLDTALGFIDLPALDCGDQEAFLLSLDRTIQMLQPLRQWMMTFLVKAVGHSHIDTAWLGPWSETVETARDTFATVLRLMDEYPDFIYTQSSAQHFEWIEEKYPDLFQLIQRRVKEKRWEIVGGMWVEPDLNMPDGESLVRQLLIGKRYFLKKFDVDVTIGWNVDSFGFSWQLPQIYKKCGVKYFVTQKLSWNDTTQFPYKLFWWQAPDGSRILVYFPQGYTNQINAVQLSNFLATSSAATRFPEIMHIYSLSDHRGEDRRTLDTVLHLQRVNICVPRICFSTAQAFFNDVDQNIREGELTLPIWNDELYLEFHRGVYTTQSEVKKQIRQCEAHLQNAEKFSSWTFINGTPYPQARLLGCWKQLLFNQFHDIMPGTGIGPNFTEAIRSLKSVHVETKTILQEALQELAAHMNTEGAGTPVVLFNPLSWTRTDSVIVEAQLSNPITGGFEIRNSAGTILPSQVLSYDVDTHRLTLRVLATGVPPLGYEVIHIVPVVHPHTASSSLRASNTELGNEFFRLTIDAHTGCITSLVTENGGREILAQGALGNLLQAFVDKPKQYDAWNIDRNYDCQGWDLKKAEEVTLVENGPVQATVRIRKRFQNSTFIQNVCVQTGVPRVDVHTQVDWREKHTIIKVAFPTTIRSRFATYEIPYGTIHRPTTQETPEDQAKFEVPALRWGDLSDSECNYGFSILNTSKYGYDAKDNVIRLTLLRAPTWPDPHADEGLHEFTYALYPHPGDWKEAQTMRRAYELNFPLLSMQSFCHTGTWHNADSFIDIKPANVILTVVKKAEDDDALILRYYEFEGEQTKVCLTLPKGASRAVGTNLMENEEHEIPLFGDRRELEIPTAPYEIKTIKVWPC
jgi:alpha-mannosidase